MGGMVGIAQLVEHLVVVQDVAGSSPVTHPTFVTFETATDRIPCRSLLFALARPCTAHGTFIVAGWCDSPAIAEAHCVYPPGAKWRYRPEVASR